MITTIVVATWEGKAVDATGVIVMWVSHGVGPVVVDFLFTYQLLQLNIESSST